MHRSTSTLPLAVSPFPAARPPAELTDLVLLRLRDEDATVLVLGQLGSVQCNAHHPGSRLADHSRNKQEKRFRSMQEHIRRAHPEHYLPKLPATEESFLTMISTPPQERLEPQPGSTTNNAPNHKAYAPDRIQYFRGDYSNPASPRRHDDVTGGVFPAASALASLSHYKSGGGGGAGSDWDAEGVSNITLLSSVLGSLGFLDSVKRKTSMHKDGM